MAALAAFKHIVWVHYGFSTLQDEQIVRDCLQERLCSLHSVKGNVFRKVGKLLKISFKGLIVLSRVSAEENIPYFCLISSFSSRAMSYVRRDELRDTPASVHLIPFSRVRWSPPMLPLRLPEQKGEKNWDSLCGKKKGLGRWGAAVFLRRTRVH